MAKEEIEIFKKEYAKKVINELQTETLLGAAIKFITDNTKSGWVEFCGHETCLTCKTLDPDCHTYSLEFSFIEVLNLIQNKFKESKHDLEILDLMIKKGVDIPRFRMAYGIGSYNADGRGHQCLDQEEYDSIQKLIFKYEGRTNYAN